MSIESFTFITTKNITKAMYIQLCELISAKYNTYHELEGKEKVKFVPDAITEGGMRIILGKNNKYGKTNLEVEDGIIYKSIRHPTVIKWESIDNKTYDNWSKSDDILFPKDTKSDTIFKTMIDSKEFWLIDEIIIIADCFKSIGFNITNIPTSKGIKTQYSWYGIKYS